RPGCRRGPWLGGRGVLGRGRGVGRRGGGDSPPRAFFWFWACMALPRFEFFFLLPHRHNLILQCSNIIPTLCESPFTKPLPQRIRECSPFCSQISFPTRSRRAVRRGAGRRLGG